MSPFWAPHWVSPGHWNRKWMWKMLAVAVDTPLYFWVSQFMFLWPVRISSRPVQESEGHSIFFSGPGWTESTVFSHTPYTGIVKNVTFPMSSSNFPHLRKRGWYFYPSYSSTFLLRALLDHCRNHSFNHYSNFSSFFCFYFCFCFIGNQN
jgi:hypothetical protein